MSLSSDSNTINALGIFGRLDPAQEAFFSELELKYGISPNKDKTDKVFNHLSLVINNDVPVGEMPKYLDLLRELKAYLPLRLETSGVIVRDEMHLALTFNTWQTQQVRDLAGKFFNRGIITTYFTKVMWFIPDENKEAAVKELKDISEMVFYDFILTANKQNDENTIYTSRLYGNTQ